MPKTVAVLYSVQFDVYEVVESSDQEIHDLAQERIEHLIPDVVRFTRSISSCKWKNQFRITS